MCEHALRIDTKYFNMDSLLAELCDKSSLFYTCLEKELTEDEHVHCMMQTKLCDKSVRRIVVKHRDSLIKGNATFSVSKANTIRPHRTWQKGLNYCSKAPTSEDFPIILTTKGYTLDDTKTFHENYWKVNAETIKARSKNKNLPLFMQIFANIEMCPMYKNEILSYMEDYDYNGLERYIWEEIIHFYREEVKTFPNKFILQNVGTSLIATLLVHYGLDKRGVDRFVVSLIMDERPVYPRIAGDLLYFEEI